MYVGESCFRHENRRKSLFESKIRLWSLAKKLKKISLKTKITNELLRKNRFDDFWQTIFLELNESILIRGCLAKLCLNNSLSQRIPPSPFIKTFHKKIKKHFSLSQCLSYNYYTRTTFLTAKKITQKKFSSARRIQQEKNYIFDKKAI